MDLTSREDQKMISGKITLIKFQAILAVAGLIGLALLFTPQAAFAERVSLSSIDQQRSFAQWCANDAEHETDFEFLDNRRGAGASILTHMFGLQSTDGKACRFTTYKQLLPAIR